MAGETAKLLASIELQDKFSKTADRFSSTVSGMERKTSTLGKIGGEVTRGTQAAVTNLTKIGLVAGGVIAHSVVQGVQSLQRLEEVTVATNAVIESTGGVAGQTGEDIRQLAEKYEALNATMDDKVIQSAENMLLTFTNIREDAFEPALEAALNLNQAMGGGEEGLQSTIIQVGKALNDPIKGVAALRRVGVQLTEQQEAQIRTLVEQNDTYGAQQIILEELTTQFGGQFAAAGDTATGKMAKFRDAVEDAQMSLATAFLPVLEKVADKATTFLADPKVQQAISDFGEGLAETFDQVVEFAGRIPWGSIASAAEVLGTGAKALLTAFTSLPPWVQTAVLTGWGLNKLTGGALGNIAGALASGLVKGVLGMNAGVVNINAATVNGGLGGGAPAAGPAAAGRGLTILKFLGLASAAGFGAVIGTAIGKEFFFNPTVQPAVDFETSAFAQFLERNQGDAAALTAGLDAINDGLRDLVGGKGEGRINENDPMVALLRPLLGEQLDVLFEQREAIEALLPAAETQARIAEGHRNDASRYADQLNAQIGATTEAVRGSAVNTSAQLSRIESVQREASNAIYSTSASTAQHLAQIEGVERGTQAYTAQVAAKDFSPSFNNTTNVGINASFVISATSVSRALQIQQSATQTTFSGRGGDQRYG